MAFRCPPWAALVALNCRRVHAEETPDASRCLPWASPAAAQVWATLAGSQLAAFFFASGFARLQAVHCAPVAIYYSAETLMGLLPDFLDLFLCLSR